MLLARTSTSSETLNWIMTELMRNPVVMRRAQEEVREAAKGKLKIEESDISSLVHMKVVIKETFRIHRPIPLLLPRETLEDCEVARYRIPAKTRVYIDARLIRKDPSYWENPKEFIPERFLNSTVDFKGQHYELIPFGVGRRGCPGMNFGVLLVEFALANLLLRFNWKLPQGMTSEDLETVDVLGNSLHKKAPLRLVATPANV